MRNRKVFAIFLFCAVFSVGFVSARDMSRSGSIKIDAGGKKTEIPVRDANRVFYRTKENSLSMLVLNAISEKSGDFLKKGSVGDSEAVLFETNRGSEQFVIERARGEAFEIRSGKIETLISLQEKRDLYRSGVSVKTSEKGFLFGFSHMPEKVRYFTLSEPDRVVFDFLGIKGKIVEKNSRNIRYANHPSGMRVVFEKVSVPEYFSFIFSGSTIGLKNSGNRQFASFEETDRGVVVSESETRTDVSNKTETEKTDVSDKNETAKTDSRERVEINGVLFVGDSAEILKVDLDGEVKVKRSVEDDRVKITYIDAFIDEEKEQILDASALEGPVEEVAIFNKEGNVEIIASMKDDKYIVEGNKKTEFVFTKAENNETPVEEKVAGFTDSPDASARNIPQSSAFEEGFGTSVDVDIEKQDYSGKRISLDFKDADIHDVLRLIADIGNLNIITSDDVGGKVTVRLMNIPWDEALDVILKSKSLGRERMGDVVRVATVQTLQREKESELAKQKSQQKLEPIKARLITVNYAKADELTNQVKGMLSDRGTLNVDQRTNVLIVKDIQEVLDKTEKLVEYLDTQTPQVLIKSRIVEATTQAREGLGVEWGSQSEFSTGNAHPTGLAFPYNLGFGGSVNVPGPSAPTGNLGFSFGSIGNISNLDLTLHVMESEGKIRILSSPKISTLDNKEANIKQGVSIPITTRQEGGQVTTKYIDATLDLTVTPHITAEGSVLLQLAIKKEEPDWSNTNYLGEPAIIKKEALTEVLVQSNDTVVIGGVYTNKQSETVSKVPLLGDIPVIGWLFKQKEKSVERSELLIFLTPEIMNELESNITPLSGTTQN
ncbi:MAG: type IV pilus secretin PilQ [bacterium]